jgi:hypothetical protein
MGISLGLVVDPVVCFSCLIATYKWPRPVAFLVKACAVIATILHVYSNYLSTIGAEWESVITPFLINIFLMFPVCIAALVGQYEFKAGTTKILKVVAALNLVFMVGYVIFILPHALDYLL